MEKRYERIKIKISNKGFLEVQGILGKLKKKYTGNDVLVIREIFFIKTFSSYKLFLVSLKNMIAGVTFGYYIHLTFLGLGYRFLHLSKRLLIKVGFTHYLCLGRSKDLKFFGYKKRIILFGLDLEFINRMGAVIREFRKPDVYKGKGIRYKNEKIILKIGKQR
jgi:large subunit ribosomal protein L6